MKSTETVVTTRPKRTDEELAKLLYANFYERDHRGIYRDWNTAAYQAPETHEGTAFFLCLHVAEDILDAGFARQTALAVDTLERQQS